MYTSLTKIWLVKCFTIYNIDKSTNLCWLIDTLSQVLIFLKAEKDLSQVAELIGSVNMKKMVRV